MAADEKSFFALAGVSDKFCLPVGGVPTISRGRYLSEIFVSYERSDRASAEMLATVLEAHDWAVWWDTKIPPGKAVKTSPAASAR